MPSVRAAAGSTRGPLLLLCLAALVLACVPRACAQAAGASPAGGATAGATAAAAATAAQATAAAAAAQATAAAGQAAAAAAGAGASQHGQHYHQQQEHQQQEQQQQQRQQHALLQAHQPRLEPLPSGGRAPVLANYTFAAPQDTFELCRHQAGMVEGQEVPLEALLAAFRLPPDLAKHKAISLPQLVELLHGVQPSFRVVYEPMLSGEADVGRLLEGGGAAGGPADQGQGQGAAAGPSSARASSLPRLVHFTVKDKNQLAPHQVLSMASWAAHNPGHSLMLFDDDDVRAFMTTYYPALLPTFDGLGSQVERTDLWRYLVLCRLGGVYADSDVVAARPVAQWAPDAGLLVGIENVFATPEEARERSYSRQVQMVQWAIASQPGHPVVCRMGQYVARHVAEERAGLFLDPDRDHAILERTGPGIWSNSVHDYLHQVGNVTIDQLVAGGRVGDVRILPQTVLGCPTAVFQPGAQLPYVYHMFKGSWRLTQPSSFQVFLRKLKGSLHHHRHHQQQQQQAAAASAAAGVSDADPARAAAVAAARAASAVAAAAAAAATAAPGEAHGAGADAAAAERAMAALPAGVKRPRLPILDEQILAHKAQQQQKQGIVPQPHAHAQVHHHIHVRLHQQQQQQLRLPVHVHIGAAGASAAQQQQQQAQLGAAASGAAGSAAAATAPAAVQHGARQPRSRKLRSSQLLLVAGAVSPAYAAAGVLSEPELPSRAVGGMHALSLLVIMLLVAAVYRQHQGSCGCSWLGLFAADSGPQKPWQGSGGPGPVPARSSTLSRPGSRTMLAAASGTALAALPGGMLLPPVAPGGDGSRSSSGGGGGGGRHAGGGAEQQDVCYASSSQAAGRSHRHKRSWGSSSSFQQL